MAIIHSSNWRAVLDLGKCGWLAARNCVMEYCLNKDIAALRLLTIQTTTLCWLLGANHLVAFVNSNFSFGSIHFLGFLEVMLCGGIWGTILIFKYRPQK